MELPDFPFVYTIKKNGRGDIIEETLTVKGLNEERFASFVDKYTAWFKARAPLDVPALPPGVEIPAECPNCGNENQTRWYVNLRDRKPNLKCMECNFKYYIKEAAK